MTELSKVVRRVSAARRHEKSKARAIILSLEPPSSIGVRLQGTRQTYRLDAHSIYELAVTAHEAKIEREAKRILKLEKVTRKGARAKARRVLAGELI